MDLDAVHQSENGHIKYLIGLGLGKVFTWKREKAALDHAWERNEICDTMDFLIIEEHLGVFCIFVISHLCFFSALIRKALLEEQALAYQTMALHLS
jgi:hypothetical protein